MEFCLRRVNSYCDHITLFECHTMQFLIWKLDLNTSYVNSIYIESSIKKVFIGSENVDIYADLYRTTAIFRRLH